MTLRLGYYKKAALARIFRVAGSNYGKTSGLFRKRANAILWRYAHKPIPA